MPSPDVSAIHDCAALRNACEHIDDVPEPERPQVKKALMRRSLDLNCPDAIPDSWKVRISRDYE